MEGSGKSNRQGLYVTLFLPGGWRCVERQPICSSKNEAPTAWFFTENVAQYLQTTTSRLARFGGGELLARGRHVVHYAQFLTDSLTEKKPNLQSARYVKLSKNNPSATILDVFGSPGGGRQAYTIFQLDTREFADGGMLQIQVKVGSSEAAESFSSVQPEIGRPSKGLLTHFQPK